MVCRGEWSELFVESFSNVVAWTFTHEAVAHFCPPVAPGTQCFGLSKKTVSPPQKTMFPRILPLFLAFLSVSGVRAQEQIDKNDPAARESATQRLALRVRVSAAEPLARPATIPRARATEIEQKAISCYEVGQA